MKNSIIYLILIFSTLFAQKEYKPPFFANIVPEDMSVQTKKHRFFYLLVPSVHKAHHKMMQQYNEIKDALENGTKKEKIKKLKYTYRASTNHELLLALKPHPKSIVLAQAALESNWGTSRFFREANNVFGIRSTSATEPRIAAGIKHKGVQTIWLKKFPTIEKSIEHYYLTIGRGKAYKKFRELRYTSNDVFKLVKGLNMYSELGEKYTKLLANMIRYNHLLKYDTRYKK